MLLKIIITLSIGAFIGWVTNYLAVRMLFRPYKERKFLGIKIQGVLPKRQPALAQRVGILVATELFSTEDLKQLLNKSLHQGDLVRLLDQHVERVILEKVPLVAPMLALVLNSDLVAKIKGLFLGDIEDVLSRIVNDFGDKLDEQVKIDLLVQEKIVAFSAVKLERLMLELMRKEFRFIEIVGAVLGMLIAATQLIVL